MAKKNRPKKSKALVVWAIVTVIVLLADCVGNYLVVGLPGSMNSPVSYTHLTLPAPDLQ